MLGQTKTARKRWLIVLGGFGLGMIAAVIGSREPTVALTPETLSKANALWSASGIRHYEMRYKMHGSHYAVSVKDGIVTDLLVEGRKPDQADLSSYSVPGLYRILERELENAEQLGLTKRDLEWKLRVRFNPRYGYPERFVRGETTIGRPTSLELLEFRLHLDDHSKDE